MKEEIMDKLIKIADITAINNAELEKLVTVFEKEGFKIVYDGEYDYSAYICKVGE